LSVIEFLRVRGDQPKTTIFEEGIDGPAGEEVAVIPSRLVFGGRVVNA
jgi:hypothetical protein